MPIKLISGSRIFDRFEVGERIIWSGQSWGYHATDLQAPEDQPWSREVFLKQYLDLPVNDPQARALKRHFKSLRDRLGDKQNYICLPFYLGETSHSLIAAYPWVEGKTLKDLMCEGITRDECIRIAVALTNTIRMLHRQHIAHLDLKPANVVVQENWKDGKLYIRLIDLDAAQIDGEGLRKEVLGTHLYKSPEHYFPDRFGQVSLMSDIFTLGIMLFELLFMEHPFNDIFDYSQAIVEEAFIIPDSNYHRDVVNIISQCLSANPYYRPEADWVLQVLNKYFKSFLEVTRQADRWFAPPNSRVYVQLESIEDPVSFRRTYYETVNLDQNQLRGSKVQGISQALLRFILDTKACSLKLLDDSIEVTLQGHRLQKGDVVRLVSNQELGIGSAKFALKTAKY